MLRGLLRGGNGRLRGGALDLRLGEGGNACGIGRGFPVVVVRDLQDRREVVVSILAVREGDRFLVVRGTRSPSVADRRCHVLDAWSQATREDLHLLARGELLRLI